MRIRKATVKDATTIAKLGATIQRLHYDHSPDWFKPAMPEEIVDLYSEKLSNPLATAYLAESDGDALGFVLVQVVHRPETPLTWAQTVVEIDQIGVEPSARRLGVGHSLFGAVRKLADEVSATRLRLTTWDFNHDAHEFFESEGLDPEVRLMATPWPMPKSTATG